MNSRTVEILWSKDIQFNVEKRLCREIWIDWLVYNANFSNISAISWGEFFYISLRHLHDL